MGNFPVLVDGGGRKLRFTDGEEIPEPIEQ